MTFNFYSYQFLNYICFSENDENMDEENEKLLPPYVQMVLSIMKRVMHFLPSKHNFLPLQVPHNAYKYYFIKVKILYI